MQRFYAAKVGVLALVTLALVSCEEGAPLSSDSGFRTQYFSARDALESGKYERAARSYARLLTRAGPLEPRIRLEYAHALLRGGDNAAAAREARQLAQTQTGTARNAALAVAATAEHELGLAAIQSGDADTGKRFLQQADAAMSEVLISNPELDPLGALAGRQASIQVRLKALG
jgi:outer membrane protein assembly factor BamD (BamD/ComL family)